MVVSRAMYQSLHSTSSRRWSAAFLATVTAVTVSCLGGAILLLDSVFWRPLPGVPNVHELTIVTWRDAMGVPTIVPLSAFPALEQAAAGGTWCPFATGSLSRVTIGGVTRLRPTSAWMPSCEAVFRVQPRLGRFWTAGPDAHRGAVISERLWAEAFDRSEAAIGGTIDIDDLPFTVVGVAPSNFMGISVEIAPEIFTALTFRTGQMMAAGRPVIFRHLVGRVSEEPSGALAAALRTRLTAELANGSHGLSSGQQAALANASIEVDTSGRGHSHLRTQYADQVLAIGLIGVLLFVMALVVVAGVVSMLVSMRRREFAIRESLGATASRNTRLVLGELARPTAVGLVAAAPVSLALARVLASLAWSSPTPNSLAPGFRTASAAVFAVMAAAVLASAACAAVWRLAESATTPSPLGRTWAQRSGRPWMSVAQAAVAVGVLFATALIVRGVWVMTNTDLGYSRSGVIFGRLLALRPGPVADPHSHYTSLTNRLSEAPGISDVALAAAFPNRVRTSVRLDADTAPLQTSHDIISDTFFDVVGIPLLAGRRFEPADRAGSPVAIVSADFAARHFGTVDVIGRRLWLADPEVPHTVVGVVSATRDLGRRDDPIVYRSRWQQPQVNPMIVLGAAGDTRGVMEALDREVQAAGRDYVAGITSIEAHLARTLAPERTLRTLAIAVAGLVMSLAAVGLSCQHIIWAAADWRSTVVRVALGESRRAVVLRAARRYAAVVGAGIVAGLPLASLSAVAVDQVLPGAAGPPIWLLGGVTLAVGVLGMLTAVVPIRALGSISAAEVRRLE